MEKEKTLNPTSSLPTDKSTNEPERTPKRFNGSFTNKKKFSPFPQIERVVLGTKRVTKVTAGGRRFGFASSGLVKDKNKKLVTFVYTKGKEVPMTFQKMFKRDQRTFEHFSQ